jgi:hypothetical protein
MRTCILCGDHFALHSREKRLAGGLATHCPECSEETSVRYAGVQAGEGKMGAVQILKFNNADDRQKYLDFWWVNSGMMVGKSCQMGLRKSTPPVGFKIVAENNPNKNAKGKEN